MPLLDYVHPLQGTDSVMKYSNGNTLPLISRPFGMASWVPQTNEEGGRWFFSPHHRSLQGIRLTHQPSPWISDYGHMTFMPQTGQRSLSAFQRASSFRPEETVIQPHYFKAYLRRYRTTLELTPTIRCASMRLTFPKNEEARFIISPFDGESTITIDAEQRQIIGYTRANSGGVPENFAQYFVIQLDCAIDPQRSSTFDETYAVHEQLSTTGNRVGAYVHLQLPESSVSEIQIGTSFISTEQALLNLGTEIGQRTFDQVQKEALNEWEKTLGKIEVEDVDGAESDKLHTFYTCLYRTCLFPRIWYEWNHAGEKIHYSPFKGTIEPGPMYSDNGFWDTYRTEYPLLSIIAPTRLNEILESWVNAYKESGWMPKWVSPGERSMMPGTLIDVVFADAYVKGIRQFDVSSAYDGLRKHATQESTKEGFGRRGLADYMTYHYLPCDKYGENVSNALDYYYGDFCIAQIAKGLGKEDDYNTLVERSRSYRKLYDANTGFMRGLREDGSRDESFDPLAWGGDYCEGGPWQCSWAVQHDLLGLAELTGGKKALYDRLQRLMTMEPDFSIGTYGFEIHEMAEMAAVDFGQFAISNQPSFHIPYIFTAIGYPQDTQYWVRRTLDELFSHDVDGFPGDEDNGSMSAWYIFGALGLYPLTPGVPEYVFGSPLFKRATIHLENGRKLVIEAENNNAENVYVKQVRVNGKPYSRLAIDHQLLTEGGTINFDMTDQRINQSYTDDQLPFSLSKQ